MTADVMEIGSTERFLHHARHGTLSLPMPGHGHTAARFEALRRYARHDGSIGRLVESHADALAILHDARRDPPLHTAMAVWASDSSTQLVLQPNAHGYTLDGTKHFGGGAIIIDAALVTATRDDEQVLVLVHLRQPTVTVDPNGWNAAAFADAGLASVHFATTPVGRDAVVGEPGFYGNRCGFWDGAVGVAAGWAGLLDVLIERMRFRRRDDLSRSAAGELAAIQWGNDAALAHAAHQIDDARNRTISDARNDALAARHCIREFCEQARRLIDHETGPAPLVFDTDWQRRRAELDLAILQSHGRRDAMQIG